METYAGVVRPKVSVNQNTSDWSSLDNTNPEGMLQDGLPTSVNHQVTEVRS